MNVLITGIAGFVGRRLARRLLEAGDEVSGMVLSLDDPEVAWIDPRAKLHVVDLLDAQGVEELVAAVAPDVVVHLGGLSAVGASWSRVADYYQVNVQGTANLFAALGDGTDLVLASSAEVYGRVEPSELPLVEDRELRPPSPYALTKAATELLTQRNGATIVRSFNLIGAGQASGFALPDFAFQLAKVALGRAPAELRVGNLEARRDFLHVEDGVSGYETLIRRGERGGVYNLASGTALSIRELLERLIAVTGLEVEVRLDPERVRPIDVPVLVGDASRLRGLGWAPEHTIDEALEEMWQASLRRQERGAGEGRSSEGR